MTLFVNDLTVIDFSFFCPQRGPVGESWIVDLTLDGDLNDESMLLDFGLVKKQIKGIIDNSVDHTLAVPTKANIDILQGDDKVTLESNFGDNNEHHFAMSGPKQAVCLIDAPSINEQVVTEYLVAEITPQLPENVKGITLTLRAEQHQSFYYHYSHGLKKHDGNCQRIVHGHRSTLGVWLDGMAMPSVQKQWAQRWADIYLVSEEDVVEAAHLQDINAAPGDICSRYHANQGEFELAISAKRTEVLPCDTTVECIADYMAKQIKQAYPDKQVEVRAYEGVGKGAIGYA